MLNEDVDLKLAFGEKCAKASLISQVSSAAKFCRHKMWF